MDFNSKYKSSEIEELLDLVANGEAGGGGGSARGAYALINHGTDDTTLTLTPNTFHFWDEVANLTLTLGSETSGVANEYLFQFTSGFKPTTLILPDNVKFNSDLAIEENKIYQISILNGLGTVMSWEGNLINLITFTVDGVEYQAEKGMTWEAWVNSDYNTDGFYISGNFTYKDNKYIYMNGEPYAIILNNQNYTLYEEAGGGGSN